MPYLGDIFTFEEIVEKFRTKEWDIKEWNWCIGGEGHYDKTTKIWVMGTYTAYIMGEGAEQCLTSKHGYETKKEIEDLYHSLGVRHILPI